MGTLLTKKYINSSKFFDFNRDGAWDYEYYKSFYYDTRVKLNKNKELGTDFGEERVFCKDRVSGFADFNNDGYLDGYYYNDDDATKIITKVSQVKIHKRDLT